MKSNREILYEELVKLNINVSMLTQRSGSDFTLAETADLLENIRKMMIISDPDNKEKK